MTIESNKALVWRYFIEVLNDRNLAAIEELFSPSFIDHPTDGGTASLQDFLTGLLADQTAFPDLEITILDQIADRDRVVTRCTAHGTHLGPYAGLLATAISVKVDSIHIFRIREDRICEHWGMVDRLGLLRQLGAGSQPLLAPRSHDT